MIELSLDVIGSWMTLYGVVIRGLVVIYPPVVLETGTQEIGSKEREGESYAIGRLPRNCGREKRPIDS